MGQNLREILHGQEPKECNSVTVTALVTAGPRKSTDESFELGEDAAGITNCGKLTAFWLADGTTSSSAFGSLSTRRLAQDLGAEFLRLCSRISLYEFDTVIPREFCDEVCHSVQSQWQKRVDEFWESLKPEHREAIYLRLPPNTAGSRCMDWSVVFVCGVVDAAAKSAIVIQCGDCFAYFFTGDGARIDFLPRSGRLFLRLRISNVDSPPIVTFVPNEETFASAKVNDLTAFVCMTDGLARSRTVSRWLNAKNLSHSDFLEQILSVRAEMDDDRGVVYGGIKSHTVPLSVDITPSDEPSDSDRTESDVTSNSPGIDCDAQLPIASPVEDVEPRNE